MKDENSLVARLKELLGRFCFADDPDWGSESAEGHGAYPDHQQVLRLETSPRWSDLIEARIALGLRVPGLVGVSTARTGSLASEDPEG